MTDSKAPPSGSDPFPLSASGSDPFPLSASGSDPFPGGSDPWGCWFLLWVVTAILVGVSVTPAQEDARHVVIVSIDGFAAYHLNNTAIELPNIRDLAARGVRADSSETVFPSVTHPSHTTIITGRTPRYHGVVGNHGRNRLTGERFHFTNLARTDSVKTPTLFDAAKQAGLTTAAFFWPETRDDPAIDFNVPEVFTTKGTPPSQTADVAAVSPAVLSELREAGVPIDDFFRYYEHPYLHGTADEALTLAAAHVIRTRRPHLLTIHLLVTDKMQHEHGPEHYLSSAALTTADYCVGILRRAIADAGIADRTTFLIVADHGFDTVKWEVNVQPAFADQVLAGKVTLHAGGWTAFVETQPGFDPVRDQPLLDRALDRAAALPGVRQVVRPAGYHDLGLPTYEESPYIAGQYLLIGEPDTFLVANAASPSTTRTARPTPYYGHGYLPSHPRMYPSLVLSGRGIAKGQRIGHVRNLDIAPTVATLLGLRMEGLEGRVLTEAAAIGGYSVRSATSGSTFEARQAGTALARSATIPSNSGTTMNVCRSRGCTPYRSVTISPVIANASTRPTAMPVMASTRPCRRTSPRISRGLAPIATRTPISRVRWLTR
jgi:Type I phosphodiesterase / nucleotide pyrophosphatase